LHREDVAEGWCDECGKRLPAHLFEEALIARRPVTPRPAAPETSTARSHAPSPDFLAVHPADEPLVSMAERWQAVKAALLSPAATLVLLAVALLCFFLPWGSYKGRDHMYGRRGRDGVELKASQTGLQMMVGSATVRVDGKPDDARDRLDRDIEQRRWVGAALFLYPLGLLAAAGALLLLEGDRRLLWATVWAGLAFLALGLQSMIGLPFGLLRANPTSGWRTPWFWISLAAPFLVLLLSAWRTRPSGPAASSAPLVALLLFAGVAVVYGVSFLMSAATVRSPFTINRDGALTAASGTPLNETDLTGGQAFSRAFTYGEQCWTANFFLWMGLLLLAVRRWAFSAAAGGIALLLALSYPLHATLAGRSDSLLAGYWLWLGSMAALAGGGLVGWLVWRE
jgi:hypothetical protein